MSFLSSLSERLPGLSFRLPSLSRRGVLTWVGAVVAGILAIAGLSGLVPDYLLVIAGLAVVTLVFGLTVYEPVAIPVLMMPLITLNMRMPGDLSVSDFALGAGFVLAAVFAPRPYTRTMRSMLWMSFVYQVGSLFTVVVNPYAKNTIEWFHAWVSVAGALVMGWAVGRAGRARVGLTLLLIPCFLIGGLAIAEAIKTGNFTEVYLYKPFGMHKNYIGCLLAVAALVLYANPLWVGWPRWFVYPAFWFCAAVVVISGARQALVGLAVGIFIIALRKDPDRRRSKLVFLAAIPGIAGVVMALQEQLTSGNQHNSANQRLVWYAESLEMWWNDYPLFGAGLRFWTTGRTPIFYQPPNAEIEVLASTGIVGVIGFVAMFIGGLVVLWRMNPRYGTLAFALLAQRFTTAQFDLFWSSVQVSLPFVLIGVCIGAQAYADSRARARTTTGLPLPRDGLRSVEEMASA